MTENNENTNKKETKVIRPFPKWASILIVVIFLLEVVFIISLFAISFFKHIPFRCFEKEIESSLLADGIAIIGVAVAVWAGLNIANAIEKKDYERLNENINHIQKISENIEKEQASAYKASLLRELYNTNKDASTRIIIEIIRENNTIPTNQLLLLLEIERCFSSVYYLHKSEYSYNTGLLKEADHGIALSESLFKENLDTFIQKYVYYRIAEFNFYSGYCCNPSNRIKFFENAVKNYFAVHDSFGALLPTYEEFQDYSELEFKKIDEKSAEISSYFCNSIGESYSKIIQIKDKLTCSKAKIKEMEQQAIFYCGYAANWGSREVYWRNFGCAIERTYGVTKENYDGLLEIYKTSFNLEAKEKSFKTLLSCIQKLLAKGFGIGNIKLNDDRKPPLNDKLYFENYSNSTSVEKLKMDSMLKELCDYSSKAKTIYPSDTVGYDYSCFYHIYMCIVNWNNNAEIDKHKALGNEDLQILKILAPNAALTKILEKDLAAF